MNPRDSLRWEHQRDHPHQYRAPLRPGGVAAVVCALALFTWAACRLIERWWWLP